MSRWFLFFVLLSFGRLVRAQPSSSPLQPFLTDEHTLLLYHFDEGQGATTKDASGHGNDGELRGAVWDQGKFGKALLFDGKDDSVFRHLTPSLEGLKQITVECWFNQDDPTGRQFFVGKDVTFHFDMNDGAWTSMSLYNKGGAEKNVDGLPHQHLGASLGFCRTDRWHHNAATYDGRYLSFFFDGVLKQRVEAAKDFLLGVPSRGLWVGCYVGTDFWFSGRIDEVRVSDCVRYDPERNLKVGDTIFALPSKTKTVKEVRMPRKTGSAKLTLTLNKLHGGNASGWIYLKPPGKSAAIVGRYELKDLAPKAESQLEIDVSEEVGGDGTYLLGLEATDASGYFAAVRAELVAGARTLRTRESVSKWQGELRSRRTFNPPLLVPLRVGARPEAATRNPQSASARHILLLPTETDRLWGELDLDNEDPAQPARLVGNGYAEWWLVVPTRTTYRVWMRYASGSLRPCDIVIDGDDLNDFNMCALNRTEKSRPRDALWEYQGTTTLAAGVHWLRVQDVLPDIVALRLELIPPQRRSSISWGRFKVPEAGLLSQASSWSAQSLFGQPKNAKAVRDTTEGQPSLSFATEFANTDMKELWGGDGVRLSHEGAFDLEPFGRLRFRYVGAGSGHVVALRLVDAKGDEKLLWRHRDNKPGSEEMSVPISFEGNDVFDPGRVVALCLDLDEGNAKADQLNSFQGVLVNPVFDRRDEVNSPGGYDKGIADAKQALTGVVAKLKRETPSLLSPGFRPWVKPVTPEEHPLYSSTEPKPVTRQTLGYGLHFTGARDIGPQALDDFHKHYNFGDVCWPHIGICPQRPNYPNDEAYQQALKGFETQLQEVKKRGLYLFDIWGYVPYMSEYPSKIAPEHHEILLRVFGDRFLGYDNGEQDGRYIGSYADQGKATNRREGWEDFVSWDEHVCNDSMNYMNATGSLNFSHYYGERGARTLGLETAQGLPSDTLMFAFLRGASKQYGRLTTQATSIWSRFGYNIYSDRRTDGANGYGLGPNKGCSRSLHKRLFFQSYLGGDSIVGSETAQFTADRLENGAAELSPLGKQHVEIHQWVKEHPDRGVLYTPVAFMLDFHNGWNMPRHLYRGDKYKIWGKLPYEKGDYLTEAVFRMVWPGYEDCSYLRNERGFLTPTPYGDIFDVLTNRCHPDILKQYTSLMLLGEVEMNSEVVKNLTEYVRNGGDLLLDAPRARALSAELTGVNFGASAKGLLSHLVATRQTFGEQPYTYTVLLPTTAKSLLVNESGHSLLTVNRVGKGRVIVGAVDHWMTDPLTYRVPEIVNMEPPYLLLNGVRAALDQYFDSFSTVQVEPEGLNVRTCCYDNDRERLLVGLTNNDLSADWQGKLKLRTGEVASARELRKNTPVRVGREIALTVPAGDVAIIELKSRGDLDKGGRVP